MSYEIVYNKQFVKLRKTGEVIPMFLMGSNNCFDVGLYGRNGRRARDWSNLRFYNRKGKISDKPDSILAKLDAELQRMIRDNRKREDKAKPADIRKRFGYYASLAVNGGSCGGTSWDLWRSQFTNGIKNAMTVEDLDKLGVNLYFHDVSINGSPPGKPAQMPLKTEQQYFSELKKWRQWRDEHNKMFWVSFLPHDDNIVIKRLRTTRRKPPREKITVQQDHYFVLTDGYHGLVKYVKRGYRYSFTKGGGKRFRTEIEADQYKQRLIWNGRYKADIWKVERINNTANFKV